MKPIECIEKVNTNTNLIHTPKNRVIIVVTLTKKASVRHMEKYAESAMEKITLAQYAQAM